MTDVHAPSAGQPRADFAALLEGWSRTRLIPVTPLDPRLTAVVSTIAATCNLTNGVQFAQWRVDADPAVADYFARNRIDSDFFRHFFAHPDVRQALLFMPPASRDELHFYRESGPEMTERLERAILSGGAYRSFKGSAADARKLVADFAAAIGERFGTAGGWLSEEPWNPWFCDVAWDRSFFWFDRGTAIATVLLTTDTD